MARFKPTDKPARRRFAQLLVTLQKLLLPDALLLAQRIQTLLFGALDLDGSFGRHANRPPLMCQVRQDKERCAQRRRAGEGAKALHRLPCDAFYLAVLGGVRKARQSLGVHAKGGPGTCLFGQRRRQHKPLIMRSLAHVLAVKKCCQRVAPTLPNGLCSFDVRLLLKERLSSRHGEE